MTNRTPRGQRTRYTWLLLLVVAAGVAASLAGSFALYRGARHQWAVRAGSDAQRLSSMLLGWIDESYAPLSGLAALVESSDKTRPEEFLNALEGIESRSATVLLGAVGLVEQDAKGKWALAISSGNVVFLEQDAADGFAQLEPLFAMASTRPNQFVLGPPFNDGDERLISPVVIALTRVKNPHRRRRQAGACDAATSPARGANSDRTVPDAQRQVHGPTRDSDGHPGAAG
jgi:two-component system sensor histidine kinase/response regulator